MSAEQLQIVNNTDPNIKFAGLTIDLKGNRAQPKESLIELKNEVEMLSLANNQNLLAYISTLQENGFLKKINKDARVIYVDD